MTETDAERAISALLDGHPCALRVLAGQWEPPDTLPPDEWRRIVEAARSWIAANPRRWRMAVDFFVWVKPNKSRSDGSMLKKTARSHGVSRNTISSNARRFIREVAGGAAASIEAT